jgi:molybdopterin-binding protein
MAPTAAARDDAPPVRADVVSLAEHVCLALVADGVTHGWALGTLLAPDGELGRIWSLSRPLTYRAVDNLVGKSLVSRRGVAAGRGRDRVLLTATRAGREQVTAWLDEPVEHVRDVRTELLVKLWLRERARLGTAVLLGAQADVFTDRIGALTTPQPDDDLVDVWRRESALAVQRFLVSAGARAAAPSRPSAPAPAVETRKDSAMHLSARNQLGATVGRVTHGEVMASVRVSLADGQEITAAITEAAAAELALATGDDVLVVIKSTDVMLAVAR